MHASFHVGGEVCAQKGYICSPDSIDTSIFLIHSNLAEIWAQACKHIACMHDSLPSWIVLCTQRGLVCSPNSIDTFIFLIQHNLAEIWAQACKQIVCMHASLSSPVKLFAQRGLA